MANAMNTPIMIGARSASSAPSMSNARTAKTAIKAMPTASKVAAASTAKRLNCRSRSSLVLNMADRRASRAAATADPAKVPAGQGFTQNGRRAEPGNKKTSCTAKVC